MKVQLNNSGFFNVGTPPVGETPSHMDVPALLVYVGNFESMNGLVEVKEEHVDRLIENHNSLLSRVVRMASGEVPLKHCPPLQLDHSVSAKDTVGRVVGELRAGLHEVEPGKQVKAVYGVPRVLGKENVEKVLDGRWTHFSIGADLEEGKLSELSITPFPAASDAALLRAAALSHQIYKGHQIETLETGGDDRWVVKIDGEELPGHYGSNAAAMREGRMFIDEMLSNMKMTSAKIRQKEKGAKVMFEKLKALLMGKKMSESEALAKLAQMSDEEKAKMANDGDADDQEKKSRFKKHLMEQKQMSEADADKKLKEMNMDDEKKLAYECDEHDKKLAADKAEADRLAAEEEKKESEKKLTAARTSLTQLSTAFRSSHASAQVSARKAQMSSRLSKLRAEAKITPAEVKKIDLAKLATETEATVNAVFKSYEDREPVILTGVFGSKKGVDSAEVYKNRRISELEAETRANMSLLSKTKPTQQEPNPAPKVEEVKLADHKIQVEKEISDLTKLMDDGKLPEAKERLKVMMSRFMGVPSEEYQLMASSAEAEMSALAESVKKMQTEFEQLMQLATSLAGGKL